MLVDTLIQPQTGSPNFSLSSAFEDFFNMDMITSSNSSGSSTSSPHSPPASSFPLTPPQQPGMQSFNTYDLGFDGAMGSEDFMGATSYFENDYSKPTTNTGYDFLSAFNALASTSSFSDSSSAHSFSDPSASPQELFAIDPALVGTPSPGKALSEFEHQSPNEEQHEDDDADADVGDDDADDNDNEHAPSSVILKAIAPSSSTAVKVAGKGKNRKGTVVSGGIKKNKENAPTPSSTNGGGSEFGFGKEEDKDSDDWRPSPEEYKKMSSKEKRQLRNKISARNFRVRRKEYISTLEADIASRDSLISAIRSELGSSKSENIALRQEIAALKKTLINGRGSIEVPVLPPPAPLSPPPEQKKERLAVPNTQKDLPTSPRIGARGFWGGANLGMGSGFTPVHTTFVPPMVSAAVLSRKPENINPALNMPAPPSPPPILSPSPFTSSPLPGVGSGFDAFADMNPFTLKTLDAYRMQLWGKMAAQNHQWQHHHQQHQHQHQQQQAQPSVTGLAGSLRPSFFRESGQQSLSGLLSGKASISSSVASYSIPPSTPPTKFTSYSKTQEREREHREHAMYAAIASQTILRKLSSAFWDAFSGGSSPSSKQREWDADKVRKVLEGRAVVKIVDVDGPATPSPKLPAVVHGAPKAAPVHAVKEREHTGCAMADILAESMSTLTLGKK